MKNALRPGEVFALRWHCFNHAECSMRLVETVYKGKIRPWGKTRKSLGVVHVPKELADDLWIWKQGSPNSSPETFIFPNKKRRVHGQQQLPEAGPALLGSVGKEDCCKQLKI